jgi:predicted HNH restriction endonuclease
MTTRKPVDWSTTRKYHNAETTPYCSQGSMPNCEHCDGERSEMVREDRLRGFVCPPCDSSFDEMYGK